MSDGALTPNQLIDLASERGVDMLSITDHDTLDAYAHTSSVPPGMRLIPGIELSSRWRNQGVHIVGLNIDLSNPVMASAVAERTKPMANVYVGSVPVAATQAPAAMKVAVELSGENKKMLWIPPGFAHGFATLEDDTVFLYKCTDTYSPEHEGSILWSDESLQIDWKVISPSLSEKDQKGPNFVEFDSPFTYAP